MKHSPPNRSLRELAATFLAARTWTEDGKDWRGTEEVDTLTEADGIMFLCPKCFHVNQGPTGTHVILCWFLGKVEDTVTPGPGRWLPGGTGLDDLTFINEGSRSVLLTGGCHYHGYVIAGEATCDEFETVD